jgi:hypothetical protein
MKNYNLKKEESPPSTNPMINEMQQLIQNNDMLKNIMGDNDGNSILTAITNIMGNNQVMSNVFESEAFKNDILTATENKTDFLDIFSTVFNQVATNPKVFKMVTESTNTLQEEIQKDEVLRQSIMNIETQNNKFL